MRTPRAQHTTARTGADGAAQETRRPGSRGRFRTAAALTALVAAGTAALAGCGGDKQTVGNAPPKKKDPFVERAEAVIADWPKVSPLSGRNEGILPLAGAERPKEGGAAREFAVTVGHGACDADFGVHTHETKNFVVVSGWGKKKDKARMCTAQLATDTVRVKLKAELGDRTIVDAATGKQLAKNG